MKRAQQVVTKKPEVRKELDPRVIEGLANLAERGVVVTGDLNDGSFVALMVELRKRGNEPIARSEAARQLKPFMVVVGKRDEGGGMRNKT
jgi:hypothetical protein